MEVMAGLSLGTRTLRIRVSFYSAFKVQRGKNILYLLGRKKTFCGPLFEIILQKNIPQFFELRDTFIRQTTGPPGNAVIR